MCVRCCLRVCGVVTIIKYECGKKKGMRTKNQKLSSSSLQLQRGKLIQQFVQ